MTMGERIVVMKGGLMQQVASPMDLYDRPANRFVAGFIGTPPMNFFEGNVRASGGALAFEANSGVRLAIAGAYQATLAGYRDKPVTMGVRPEDIGSSAAEQSASGATRIRAVVDVVEHMGSESYVHLRADSALFVIRAEAHRKFRPGEAVAPAVTMDKAHFFDPTTETRIA
jgi:multiple sugar transport system ATP-binding protein